MRKDFSSIFNSHDFFIQISCFHLLLALFLRQRMLQKHVFICVSSLPVPFCSRWFHLQTSKMVLFVTVTIANVVFCCAIMLHLQFRPINLFFCVSLVLTPSRYRWFQVISACSRWFQLHSNLFQLIPCFTMHICEELCFPHLFPTRKYVNEVQQGKKSKSSKVFQLKTFTFD